jgi:predicted metal-binding membrane protein
MTADGNTLLENVLRRERLVLLSSLVVVIGLAWLWLLLGAGTGMSMLSMSSGNTMAGMADMMMRPADWTPDYAIVMFTMWWVMMTAMMLPSAAPVLLLFARINRTERAGGRPYVPTGIFAAGYLAVWGGFSALATAAQWGFQQLGLLSPMMATPSRLMAAVILIGAGIWQLTPIKRLCLRHCRSPLGFFAMSWRRGAFGAFRMGLEHGAYCLGCCWFLMALLFVGGVMNLLWIGGLAIFVLIEKVLPLGNWVGRLAGIAAIAWGTEMLVNAATV